MIITISFIDLSAPVCQKIGPNEILHQPSRLVVHRNHICLRSAGAYRYKENFQYSKLKIRFNCELLRNKI